jgi:hypothetical protein
LVHHTAKSISVEDVIMLINYRHGQNGIILRVKILDASRTDGGGLLGLAHSSTGLAISTIADNESSPTSYTSAGGRSRRSRRWGRIRRRRRVAADCAR